MTKKEHKSIAIQVPIPDHTLTDEDVIYAELVLFKMVDGKKITIVTYDFKQKHGEL